MKISASNGTTRIYHCRKCYQHFGPADEMFDVRDNSFYLTSKIPSVYRALVRAINRPCCKARIKRTRVNARDDDIVS